MELQPQKWFAKLGVHPVQQKKQGNCADGPYGRDEDATTLEVRSLLRKQGGSTLKRKENATAAPYIDTAGCGEQNGDHHSERKTGRRATATPSQRSVQATI